MTGQAPPVMAAPILAGAQRQARGAVSRALRPEGTGDWLLVATLSGVGYVRSNGRSRDLTCGDLLLFRPGAAQDYGHRDDDGCWRNVWIHFRPREDWLRWLAWPAVAPGVMLRREAAQLDRLAPLFDRIAASADGTLLGRQKAMNALEQVLLTLARDPEDRGVADPRLQRVLDHIAADPAAPLDLTSLAAIAGLSRSRLNSLFREQTGQTSQAYVEGLRLLRAAELLHAGRARVAQAAEAAGFSNPFYFATRFRKTFGATPSQYRRAALRGSGPSEPAVRATRPDACGS